MRAILEFSLDKPVTLSLAQKFTQGEYYPETPPKYTKKKKEWKSKS